MVENARGGEIGEVVARGQGCGNRDADTKETLWNCWMHSADAGYMNDEGLLFIIDRLKDVIVTASENV
jgi:acyl-CoA synthetase (AMP-forming)/AMP-acid ligase II